MTPYQKRPCPLTIRLAEDLKIRNMSQRTIDAYTYHAGKFADFIEKSLDRVTPEDVRSFQLHMIEERKLAYSSFNQAVCALRFLYTHTIKINWPITMVPYGKRPKTLPVVLSRQEVDDLLRCTINLKQRMFFTTLYATGMRFSEAAHLQISDIDSDRMQLRIVRGKGAKDRQVPLSPRLLAELREYWKISRVYASLVSAHPARSIDQDSLLWKLVFKKSNGVSGNLSSVAGGRKHCRCTRRGRRGSRARESQDRRASRCRDSSSSANAIRVRWWNQFIGTDRGRS